MNVTKFHELDEYCKLDILKYVPIQDKVRFERVNKAMEKATSSSLAAQKVVQFVEEPKSGTMIQHSFCGIPSHHVCAIDNFICSFDGRRSKLYPDWKLKVLRKMPNLKVLILDGDELSFENQELALLLSTMSEIEHFEGSIDDVKNVASTNLKCVGVLSHENLPDIQEVLDTKAEAIYVRQGISKTEIPKLLEHGHHLKVIDLRDDHACFVNLKSTPSIQKLKLPMLIGVEDSHLLAALQQVAELLPPQHSLDFSSWWRPMYMHPLRDIVHKSRLVLKTFVCTFEPSELDFYKIIFRTCLKLEVLEVRRFPTVEYREPTSFDELTAFEEAAPIAYLFQVLEEAPSLRTIIIPHFGSISDCWRQEEFESWSKCPNGSMKWIIRFVISYAKAHAKRRVTFKLIHRTSRLTEINSEQFDVPANLKIEVAKVCACLKEFEAQKQV